MDREAIVKAAEQYIGVPFQHQGRTRHGLDCVGLVLRAYWDAGHPITDYTRYGRYPRPTVMRRELLEKSRRVEKGEEWLPADVIWLRIRTQPQHLAMWTGKEIIHAYATTGRVVRQPLDGSWRAGIEAVLRYE